MGSPRLRTHILPLFISGARAEFLAPDTLRIFLRAMYMYINKLAKSRGKSCARSNYHCYARGSSMQPSRLGKLCVCVCTLIGLTCLLAPSVHIHVAQNSVGYTFGLSTAELSRAALWVGEHRGARLFFKVGEQKNDGNLFSAATAIAKLERRKIRN